MKDKRILAVDDEVDAQDALQDILKDFEGLIFDRATDYDTGLSTFLGRCDFAWP